MHILKYSHTIIPVYYICSVASELRTRIFLGGILLLGERGVSLWNDRPLVMLNMGGPGRRNT